MYKLLYKLLIIGLLNLLVFLGIFRFLQEEGVYHATLGKISSNYLRVKVNGETQIQKVKAPYVDLTSERMNNWDADIYRCIKENNYTKDGECYSEVKSAFFPLLPMIWKVSQMNSLGIALFNYLLFILSVAILLVQLFKGSDNEKILLFSVFISIPSAIIYYIPYTEALFLFTMTIAFIAHKSGRYYLFFVAVMALAMLRPASLFILLAIFAVDLLCFVSHKKAQAFFKGIFKKSLPFLCGYFLTALIQYSSTSSFSSMLNAQKYWQGSIGIPTSISDWSIEGFGLNSFALFFLAIPSLIFVLSTLFRKGVFRSFYHESTLSSHNTSKYFLLISLFYLSGILCFIFMTSEGNLHSFFRFIMCSPPFYIVLILLLNELNQKNILQPLLLFFVPLLFLLLFLIMVEYGGSRFDFSFAGMYLCLACLAFLYFRKNISEKLQWIFVGSIILLSLIWNSYLLNIFLNEGWIFT
jgi:hypothetical protein